jgi:excisionase family DNA binding protein
VPSTPKLSPTDQLWSDKDVAAYLRVSVVSVRRLRYRGVLPYSKVGAAVRIPRSAVLAYAAPQTSGGAA